mmetsp:Transcript_54160/g.126022  ORF Transcript_54160/g.126022 Transcript_54160/m.126022 type:complete len:245 (-) Transcript_54160:345-1079(-)
MVLGLLQPALCTLHIASAAAGCDERVVAHNGGFQPIVEHPAKPLLCPFHISLPCSTMQQCCVGHIIGLTATLKQALKPTLSLLRVVCLHTRIHQDVIADCCRSHAVLAHPGQPLLGTNHLALLGASVDQAVVAHSVGLLACTLELQHHALSLEVVARAARTADCLVCLCNPRHGPRSARGTTGRWCNWSLRRHCGGRQLQLRLRLVLCPTWHRSVWSLRTAGCCWRLGVLARAVALASLLQERG